MNKNILLSLTIVVCIVTSSAQVQTTTPQDEQKTEKEQPMVKVNTGLSDKARKEIATLLNELLANEYTLYTKTLKYHWNVEGKMFDPLHLFFKRIYEELFLVSDDIAERVRALGHKSFGTLTEFSQNASLKENPGKYPDDTGMLQDLLDGHEEVIRSIRKIVDKTVEVNDMGTNNFLCGLLERQEKTAWMLRASVTK